MAAAKHSPPKLIDISALLDRDIAIIAGARGRGASHDGTAGEFGGDGFIDAGFVGWRRTSALANGLFQKVKTANVKEKKSNAHPRQNPIHPIV
jgi:hypothetical protein